MNDMIFNIKKIIKYLMTDNLTDKNEEDLYQYINNLTIDELKIFKKLADDFKYYKKYLGENKYKITKNAINMSYKIYNNIGIKTFPYINRIAQKGYSISDGTFAWGMYELREYPAKQVYCSFRAKECLKKNCIFEYEINDGEIELYLIDKEV